MTKNQLVFAVLVVIFLSLAMGASFLVVDVTNYAAWSK